MEKLFLSSTGEGMALRWKAFFASIIPIISLLGPLLGVDFLTPQFLDNVSNAIATLILGVWGIASIVLFVKGWARAKYNKENQLGKFSPQQ